MIQRRILAAVALLCAFVAPVHAQKTKTALTSEINTNWPDNNVGTITPAILRSTVIDIVNSYYDLNGGTSLVCAAHQWVAGLPTLSSITCTQPAITDLSGFGTGVATALGNNAGGAGGFALFNSLASYLPLAGGTMTGNILMGSNLLTGLPSPVNTSDAATKAYVDALASGLTVLAGSRLATTTALASNTYNNGTAGVGATLTATANAALSVDGASVNVNDIVLIKNESTAANNGIYTVTQTGSVSLPYILTRVSYFNASSNMLKGSFTFISAGSTNINTAWVLNTTVATVGTSAVVFNQFSSAPGQLWLQSGSAAYYSSGNVGIGTSGPTAPLDVVGGAPRFRSLTSCGGVQTDGSGNTSCGSSASLAYTPQGTGGVTTTAAAQFNRTIWANDYGAVCNGTTDDHVAFQNAINEGQTLGLPVRFTGSCAIATALSITNTLDFAGTGPLGSSTLIPATTIDGIDIVSVSDGYPVYLHDFTISYPGVPSAGTQAISVDAAATHINGSSHFWNLTINNAMVGINFKDASTWAVNNVIISASGVTNASGIFVADSVNPDNGDSSISASLIQPGPGGIGILWTSSGGLRVINNKILGSNIAVGVQFNLASGAVTSDVLITGNSIEGFGTNGVGVGFARSGTTGGLGNIIINGNQIGGPKYCVLHPTDANGSWTNAITVNGNVCQLNATANGVGVFIDSAAGVVVTNNNFVSGVASDVPIQIGTTSGASAISCVVALNPRIGAWAASSVNSCAAVAPY